MKSKTRILLIEDNHNILLVEKICLEASGFEVLEAEDGIQGLEMAINNQPDLILLDILIPKMNGYLVLEALQNNNAASNIPVLVTSAKAQAGDLKQAFAFNIQGYLIKPFTSQELLSRIHEILG
ncbi:MAG TPA: response regulator [Firmicutes bacterium]|jgi:CheY-like chemotaxis protein|nr:response regulator [Bacillota bacterium]